MYGVDMFRKRKDVGTIYFSSVFACVRVMMPLKHPSAVVKKSAKYENWRSEKSSYK